MEEKEPLVIICPIVPDITGYTAIMDHIDRQVTKAFGLTEKEIKGEKHGRPNFNHDSSTIFPDSSSDSSS